MTEVGHSMTNDQLVDESNTSPDLRTEYRLCGRASVVLELEAADGDSGAQARVAEYLTKDVSPHGIRLETSEPLQVGALLPTTVRLDASSGPYDLVTEVIWCKPQSNARWTVGLRVVESDGTSMIEWLDALASALAAE